MFFHPLSGTQVSKKEMLKRVQHDKDSGVILNLFQDLKRKSIKCHITLLKQEEILRQEESLSLPCTNHAQNDMEFKIGTNICHPEDEVRRIYKNGIQEILCFAPKYKKCAFTLAEVLITLGIIGIVAAMTMPILIGKYQKKQVATQLKKVYSLIQQATQMAEKDYEDVRYWNFNLATKEFNDIYIKPYYKIIKEYAPGEFPSDIHYIGLNGDNGDSYTSSSPSNQIVLADGTILSFKVAHTGTGERFVNVFADINGFKKPNQYGRDMFLFSIQPNSRVIPYGIGMIAGNVQSPGYDRDKLMESSGSDLRSCARSKHGIFCAAVIMMDGWEIKDDYPW